MIPEEDDDAENVIVSIEETKLPEAIRLLVTDHPIVSKDPSFVTEVLESFKNPKQLVKYHIIHDTINKLYTVQISKLLDLINEHIGIIIDTEMRRAVKDGTIELFWDDEINDFAVQLTDKGKEIIDSSEGIDHD